MIARWARRRGYMQGAHDECPRVGWCRYWRPWRLAFTEGWCEGQTWYLANKAEADAW